MSYYSFWERLHEAEKVGHLGTGGIQGWSAGDIFPYTIRIVGHGPGTVQAMAPGGEVVYQQKFEKMGVDGDFQRAHQEVEQYVKDNLL